MTREQALEKILQELLEVVPGAMEARGSQNLVVRWTFDGALFERCRAVLALPPDITPEAAYAALRRLPACDHEGICCVDAATQDDGSETAGLGMSARCDRHATPGLVDTPWAPVVRVLEEMAAKAYLDDQG